MSRLDKRDAKPIIFFAWRLRCISCGATPNIAVVAEGSMDTSKKYEKVLNIDCQKQFSFGQNQNMCERVAGACLHRSHIGSTLGMNLASFTSDQ